MKLSGLLLILFSLLAFDQPFRNCIVRGVLCDYAPRYDLKKKDHPTKPTYDSPHQEFYYEGNKPLPVKVSYEPTNEEKCLNNKKINISPKELSREELEAIKLAGTKCKKQMKPGSKIAEKIVKVEFSQDELRFSPPAKTKNVFCAECEQCELQVKANGEGVMLKCTDCHETPSDEINFSKESSRKILKLP